MARQSFFGWACAWLVSAVFWSWIEKKLWFPGPFSKRKMKCAWTLRWGAPATFSESTELSCACPIFRCGKFAEPTWYEICVADSFMDVWMQSLMKHKSQSWHIDFERHLLDLLTASSGCEKPTGTENDNNFYDWLLLEGWSAVQYSFHNSWLFRLSVWSSFLSLFSRSISLTFFDWMEDQTRYVFSLQPNQLQHTIAIRTLLVTDQTKRGSQPETVLNMQSWWHTVVENFKLLTICFTQEAILREALLLWGLLLRIASCVKQIVRSLKCSTAVC